MGLEAMFKGLVGEAETRFMLSLFPKEEYQVVNNVLIPTEQGTTQVDHVIVSQYGLFVVETKNKNGWIYGSEHDNEWTQAEFNKKYKFQNPLRQNYAHTMSLAEHLGIDHEKIHSLIVFWGSCQFKTPMPVNVCKGGILNTALQRFVTGKKQVLLSPEEVETVCSKLKEAKENSGLLNQLRHVADLKSRHNDFTPVRTTNKKPELPDVRRHDADVKSGRDSSAVSREEKQKLGLPSARRQVQDTTSRNSHSKSARCPQCGGELVRRLSTRGENKGAAFLGCNNFPKCRYMKDL